MKKRIQLAQEQLKLRGFKVGKIDGILGQKTLGALNKIPELPHRWSKSRKVVGYIQLLCKEHSIDAGPIDGYWGPQTEFGYESLVFLLNNGFPPISWRPEEVPNVNPNKWPTQEEKELNKFYGRRGTNLTRLKVPYPHCLSWNKRKIVHSFLCHEKVHDSMLRVLTRVYDHYGPDEIQRLNLDNWGGCFNKRKMRGGTRWSTHSWGIAVDYDPANNKLQWGRDKAQFAQLDYEMWWKLWEEEGWVSLGRTRNFDWMHIQAAKQF